MTLVVHTARISTRDPDAFDVTRKGALLWALRPLPEGRVMVDELVRWPQQATGQAAQHFGSGKPSCHLTTDGPLEGLHALAERIGLRRAWFQAPPKASAPHYDLTPSKRAAALKVGAVAVSAQEQIAARYAREAAAPGAPFAPSWAILGAAKRGELAWREYAPRYVAEMRLSYRANRAAWDALVARERVVLTCYCVAPAECHRTLLAEILGKLGAELRGELAEPARAP